MIEMTQSLKRFLITHHRKVYVGVTFGHIELLTDEIYNEYLGWCLTDEGKKYLEGGECYKENEE